MLVKNNYKECLTNLACSIRKYFELDYKHNTLDYIDKLLEEKQPKNVVVILFDGMGSRILDRTLSKSDFLIKHKYKEITTVFPATTTAATTSMQTGLNPIEHGYLGWNMYLSPIDETVELYTGINKETGTPSAKYHEVKKEYLSPKTIVDEINEQNKYHAISLFPFKDTKYKDLDEMISIIEKKCQKEGKKYIYTGNPVRHEIVSMAHEDIPVSEDLILVLGGSMGAAEINTLVYENLDALCSRWHVVHQAGKNGDFSIKRDNYDQREFIGDELPLLMKKAKLVITRSGANTVSELCILAKTSLLIPLRSSQSRGDQIENAAWLEERGAAAVLKDGKDFLEKVSVLMDDDTDIGENAYKLRCEDASARIASIIEGVIND